MATVRELVTMWGFDVDEGPLKELDGTLKTLKHAVAALITVETAKKLYELVSGTAEWGEQTARTAQMIGMGTDALQALQYNAKLADVDTYELTIGLKFLNTALYDSSQGSAEAQKKFKALGLSYKDANGNIMPVDKSLGQIADKFASMEDGPKKTALAVDLFGHSGINMIPMLNQGSAKLAQISKEAREFGLVMDQEGIKRSQEFMDNVKRMRGILSGLRNEVGMSLMPAFSELLKKLIEWFRVNRQAIGNNLKLFFQEISKYAAFAGKAIRVVIDVANLFVQYIGGYERATKVLAAGFTAVGTAALLMQLKFLAIPAAIFAALGAIYLLVDDIVGYFSGKDSLIGRAITEMQHRFPKAFTFMYDIVQNIGAQFKVLIDVFALVWGWLNRINVAIQNFLKPMVEWLQLALDGWKRLFSLVPGLMRGQLISGAASVQSGQFGSTDMLSGISDMLRNLTPAPATSSYRNTLKNYVPGGHVEVKPSIAITVNGGMTNEQTAGVVSDTVNRIFGDMVKQTGMDFQPAIER